MKRVYILKYRTGWGEHCEIEFRAYSIMEAQTIAKNYCTANFISVGRLISPSGRIVFV